LTRSVKLAVRYAHVTLDTANMPPVNSIAIQKLRDAITASSWLSATYDYGLYHFDVVLPLYITKIDRDARPLKVGYNHAALVFKIACCHVTISSTNIQTHNRYNYYLPKSDR
jgi:hypothetical protein